MIYSLRLATLWKRAAIFICVSDFIRQRALELGYPSDKLRVHYIGIDRRLFKPSGTVRIHEWSYSSGAWWKEKAFAA